MMKRLTEGWAKGRARVRTGDRQDGGQQINRAEELQGQVIVEDNAGAGAMHGRVGRS